MMLLIYVVTAVAVISVIAGLYLANKRPGPW